MRDTGGCGSRAVPSDYHLFGRWDVSRPEKAVTINGGSYVSAVFYGTGINAKFDSTDISPAGTPTVSFRIDGGELSDAQLAATLPLASNLAPSLHDALLFVRGMDQFEERWTPPLVARTVFLGFDVNEGRLVKSLRPEKLKLEFLGDSITEGDALHDAGPGGQATPSWRADAARNYASLTAQNLDAEWRQVGFGGQGLTHGGTGNVPKAADTFNWVYQGVPRDDWQADLVVINQGTNDRGTATDVFSVNYASFVALVRHAYPNATIVALEPFVGAFGREIEAEVHTRAKFGDANVFYVDTTGWTDPVDFTDGLHPSQAGSIKIAEQLTEALKRLRN